MFNNTCLNHISGIRVELGTIHTMAGMGMGLMTLKNINPNLFLGTSLELGGIRNNPRTCFVEYWVECRDR